MKKRVKTLFVVVTTIVISYSAISFMNWSINPGEWDGFSRVLMGLIMLCLSVNFYEDF